MTTLNNDEVAGALDRMYAAADEQFVKLREDGSRRFADLSNASAQQRADALSDIYMPVTREAGRLLYSLVRAAKPAIVVEFGMSFGLSTLHLAAAVRDNGFGRVFTTELSATKIAAAKRTFAETGLDDVITVLEGDALESLKTVDSEIGLVLLDGWKELYLPVFKLLEPRLVPGALLVADNTSMADTQPYLDYVRDPAHGYVSVNFLARDSDSMELSCRA
ncbi:putative O-methyltransferase YrrM [Mycobacterium frederiksbergense]|uniref:O-methyltransferase YrrM n=2 Tax=Mycolicibacterium frederiksbergense TaxID=117567 RepID=A0ABT6KXK3_9MYCO|nr:putative O-methyltransferase YrrM [Mycolicibacterium frederiksbergense]